MAAFVAAVGGLVLLMGRASERQPFVLWLGVGANSRGGLAVVGALSFSAAAIASVVIESRALIESRARRV